MLTRQNTEEKTQGTDNDFECLVFHKLFSFDYLMSMEDAFSIV